MSIEKDINQPRFRNEHQKMTINLIYTYNWLMERTKKFFEQADLTTQQYNILRILRGAGKPLTTLQLRQRMLDKMSDTSRIVNRMILKDLVQKVPCESDKRLVDVTITEKGMHLLETLDKQNEELDNIVNKLSYDEAKTMNYLLDKVRGSV